jgi:hypothetical protein
VFYNDLARYGGYGGYVGVVWRNVTDFLVIWKIGSCGVQVHGNGDKSVTLHPTTPPYQPGLV